VDPRTLLLHGQNTIGATTCGCGPSRYSGLNPPIRVGINARKSPFPSSDAWDFPSSSTPPGVIALSELGACISSSTVRPWHAAGHAGLLRWGFGVRSTWPRRPNAAYVRSPRRAPWLPCKASAIASRTAPRVVGTTGDWSAQAEHVAKHDPTPDWLRDKVVYGTPEKVVDRLANRAAGRAWPARRSCTRSPRAPASPMRYSWRI